MEYNIGDKVLCKRDLCDRDMVVFFFKDEYYELKDIQYDPRYGLWVTIALTFREEIYVTIASNFREEIYLSLSKYSSASPIMFYDYFYSKNELRKLKLKKIENEKANSL